MLEGILREQRIIKTIVRICFPSDDYSDYGSMQFHEGMGYRAVGRINGCGYKFDRWYDMVIMEKNIGLVRREMEEVKTFDEVRGRFEV